MTYLGNTVLDHLPHQVEVRFDESFNDLAVSLFSVIQLPPGLHRYFWQKVDRLHWGHDCAGLGHVAVHHLSDGFMLRTRALLSANSTGSPFFLRCWQDVAQPVGGCDDLTVILLELVPVPAPAHHGVLLVRVHISVLRREMHTVRSGLDISHSISTSSTSALQHHSALNISSSHHWPVPILTIYRRLGGVSIKKPHYLKINFSLKTLF